jgi:hypothetical protein
MKATYYKYNLQFKRPSELLEVLWPKKKPGLSYSKKKVKQE